MAWSTRITVVAGGTVWLREFGSADIWRSRAIVSKCGGSGWQDRRNHKQLRGQRRAGSNLAQPGNRNVGKGREVSANSKGLTRRELYEILADWKADIEENGNREGNRFNSTLDPENDRELVHLFGLAGFSVNCIPHWQQLLRLLSNFIKIGKGDAALAGLRP
jgi:hypothetical protein